MLKKFLSLILVASMICIPVLADVSFVDLGESHWAFTYVSKLVTDGTVRGYEDGSFRPDNTVTRAEFVKMIGCGPERRATDFADVPASHWGYEYIMTSGFNILGNSFQPDKAITRAETIELIWKRNGSPKGCIAPKIITSQYEKNPDAVAWAYNYKVMIGDDGLNLRLKDTLSRAEAATLIVRSREIDFSKPQSDFKDIVSEKILKTVFESYHLFDDNREYSPDATITNGEMARAALRLAEDEFNLLYSSYVISGSIDHKYSKDISIIADRCIKKGSATKEFADANANVENTLSAISFAMLQKAYNPISYGNVNNTYPDVSKDIESRKNVLLTFAYEKGIRLKADGTIGANNNVTHKDIAAIILQLDSLYGFESAFTTTKNENGKFILIDNKLNKNIASYPSTKDNFACIIEGIPNEVYEQAISGKQPKETYDFAREYGEIFINKLQLLSVFLKNNFGVDSEIVMYPSLVWESNQAFGLRVKCKVNEVSKVVTTNEAFSADTGIELVGNNHKTIEAGDEFFVEVSIRIVDLFM